MKRALVTLARVSAYALLVTAPLTVFTPLGPALAPGIFPLYVQVVAEISDVAALTLLLATALIAWTRARESATYAAGPFTQALFALAALGLLTSPFALSPPLAAYSALRWLLAAGVAWAFVRARVSTDAAAVALGLGLAAHVAVGGMQTLYQSPLGIPGESALPPSHPGAAIIAIGDVHWLRAYGLTFHPNVLGGFLCVAILLALPAVERLRLRMMWWLLWLGLFLTFSRSAWLATAFAVPVAAGWLMLHRAPLRRPLAAALAGVGGIAVCCGALLAPQLATRFGPLANTLESGSAGSAERLSLEGRVEMARAALTAIRDHPITGIGAGNFPLEMLRQHSQTAPQYVHNVPLLLTAEVGWIGGGVWTAAWLSGAVVLARGWRRHSPDRVVALCAWCGLGLIALFDSYPWALQSGRLLTAVTVALVDRTRATERAG